MFVILSQPQKYSVHYKNKVIGLAVPVCLKGTVSAAFHGIYLTCYSFLLMMFQIVYFGKPIIWHMCQDVFFFKNSSTWRYCLKVLRTRYHDMQLFNLFYFNKLVSAHDPFQLSHSPRLLCP